MNCKICSESNIGPEHEITPKHIKNKVLSEYSINRKQLFGNRKGVVVSCSVKSSFTDIVDYVDAKIKISAKPNEELLFKFTIKNETKKEDIILNFIETAHKQLNFVTSNHGFSYGCDPVTIKPKETLQKDVSIQFKCADIGQYEMPIIFSFKKPVADDESILIMRDMVVYVENNQRKHENIVSPYAQKEVTAAKLLKTSLADDNNDVYRIPKKYKTIYANGLKINDDASKEDKAIFDDVKEILSTGVTEDNYVRFFHNLLWYEETIVRINLKKYNMTSVPLYPQGNSSYALIVPGLAEKRPSLMIGDVLFVKPHGNDDVMFEGVITQMDGDNTIYIKGLHTAFQKFFNFAATFDVRFFMSRMPLERMHRAVQASAGEHSRVFPRPSGKPVTRTTLDNYYNLLVEQNPEQRRAVESIVANTAGVAPYLLHGPPGTGKTVTIVEAILQLVAKNPANRILVCTDSNMAADHVATMILKYKHMFADDCLLLRACSKFRVWETLPECLHKYSNGTSRYDFSPVTIKEFKSYRIVITTLSHAAKFARELKTKRLSRPITHLFIDEAAQASEPAALVPVTGLLAAAGALTLAGDPLQLGPVVISHHAKKLGLGLSLMERLKNTCELYSEERADADYTLMLRDNFRSHPAVLQIPNQLFYRGQLRAQAALDPISSVDILGTQPTSHAIVFHGVMSKEQRMGKSPSFYNNLEIEIVEMYVTALLKKHAVSACDIGIVTPYIRQVYKVKNVLENMGNGASGVEVGTVEAFQGKEKRIIIISTVRANCGLLDHDAKFQLGFLVDEKRFNVALTRAKAKAIVIGNPLCLEKDAKWRAYIQKCRELGTHLGFDSQMARDDNIVDRIRPILRDLQINN